MANLKSSKKDVRRTKKRTEANKPFRRNAIMLPKKITKLALSGKIDEAKELLTAAYKALDKAVRKNIFHKNTAARKKSRLVKLLNKASETVKA